MSDQKGFVCETQNVYIANQCLTANLSNLERFQRAAAVYSDLK